MDRRQLQSLKVRPKYQMQWVYYFSYLLRKSDCELREENFTPLFLGNIHRATRSHSEHQSDGQLIIGFQRLINRRCETSRSHMMRQGGASSHPQIHEILGHWKHSHWNDSKSHVRPDLHVSFRFHPNFWERIPRSLTRVWWHVNLWRKKASAEVPLS